MKELLAAWIIFQLLVVGALMGDCNARLFGKRLVNLPTMSLPIFYFMSGEAQLSLVECLTKE